MTSKLFVAFHVGRPAQLCFALGAAILASTVGVNSALATNADIVNADGFEPHAAPIGFSIGDLEGQFNPPGFAQVVSPGQWLRNIGPGTSTAKIQNTIFAPGGGSQAVQVNRAANSNDQWAVPANNQGYPDYPTPAFPEPAQNFICISWEMRVEKSTGPAGSFGPFFGVQSYDDDGNPVSTLGSLFVDATNGEVLFQKAVTGQPTAPVTNPVVAFGAWNKYAIELDYATKTYSYFLNGIKLGNETFVDQAAVVGGLNQFSDADIMAVAGGSDVGSQSLVGTAYFDNFRVMEGPCVQVPEPATGVLAVLALGGIATARRRRRSQVI